MARHTNGTNIVATMALAPDGVELRETMFGRAIAPAKAGQAAD
jgi:hypothetical protein